MADIDLIEVRVSVPDPTTAEEIGAVLVADRLAACVQVLAPIRTVYHWEGDTERDTECIMLIKSTLPRFDALRSAIEARHPYDIPEIVAVPVVAVNHAYAAWAAEATATS